MGGKHNQVKLKTNTREQLINKVETLEHCYEAGESVRDRYYIPAGELVTVIKCCLEKEVSHAQFIREAIREKMERESHLGNHLDVVA